ncbi:MAG: alpha/beta hydrolase, partial [Anaerolineae bacterium]
MLHRAEGEGQHPAAVICHPHPLGGGSMHNGVVRAIARTLVSSGVVALRFNFRGVGASEGTFDNGVGERDDVAGALDW